MPESSGLNRLVHPSWVRGQISHVDAAYLSACATIVAPRTAVEVGVASGYSSAILLDALSAVPRPADASDTWLHSFDVRDVCYFDDARRTGDAVMDLVPALRPRWQLHHGDVRDARRCLAPHSVAFAFIDAYHVHPWPILDLIGLLPLLSPGAWILLHDVRLPQLGHHAPNDGAQYLFESWPWAKSCEPIQGNIGAIHFDASLADTQAFCERLLERPWQSDVPTAVIEGIGLSGRGLEFEMRSPSIKAKMQAVAQSALGRPVMLWGAGEAGRRMLKELRDAQVDIAAVLDRDPARHGTSLDGVDIRPPHTLDAIARRPFVVLCGVYAPEMAVDLDSRGYQADVDYLLA